MPFRITIGIIDGVGKKFSNNRTVSFGLNYVWSNLWEHVQLLAADGLQTDLDFMNYIVALDVGEVNKFVENADTIAWLRVGQFVCYKRKCEVVEL